MDYDSFLIALSTTLSLRKALLVDPCRTSKSVANGIGHLGLHRNRDTTMDALEGQKCEFPKPDGKGICGQPATQVVTISGYRWSYNARACSKCADQLEKEVRVNTRRDG